MNLPSSFIERTKQLMGESGCDALCEALQHDTPVSVRINSSKTDLVPSDARRIPWTSNGYYLSFRPTFTFDPLFHAGSYYVQEASSMFVERAVKQYINTPVVALDLCAAPGGKSTLLRSALPQGSFLVANEVMRNRSQILAENIIKWGHPEVMVTSNDPADFSSLEEIFDFILTDVPCSGEGMFRKDEVAVEEWSPSNVQLCWERQRRILRDIWQCLKPGGILIYSTCTFNREENEDNVLWISEELGAEILPVDIDDEWKITGNLTGKDFPVYRFLPHKTEGEGLFLAVLRKKQSDNSYYSQDTDYSDGVEYDYRPDYRPDDKSGKKSDNKFDSRLAGRKKAGNNKSKSGKGKQQLPDIPSAVKNWINNPSEYSFHTDGSTIYAIPQKWSDLINRLSDVLYVLHKGITIAETKGKDWQPNHSLAMSTGINREAFPEAELTYEQAIAYLRKESVVLDPSVPKGYVLVTYRSTPLGFVKNIGNRANNLYPQEWRIRSGYLPEEIRMVF